MWKSSWLMWKSFVYYTFFDVHLTSVDMQTGVTFGIALVLKNRPKDDRATAVLACWTHFLTVMFLTIHSDH